MTADPKDPTTWPAYLQDRPVDPKRKLPVPPVSLHYKEVDGFLVDFVDFNIINARVGYELAQNRVCSLCSKTMGWWVAFIGGPRSHVSRVFTTPPMHPECAEASITLCPHIAIGKMKRSEADPHGLNPMPEDEETLAKPDTWYLCLTRQYQAELVRMSRTEVVPQYRGAPWKAVHKYIYQDNKIVQAPE